MPKTSPRQRKTMGRVMHEFKHDELKSGPKGKAGKVKSRKQAVAIALSEAGASNEKSPAQNRRSRARTQRKEATGRTAQQSKEGKARVGARGKRESSRAMGGKNAGAKSVSGKKAGAKSAAKPAARGRKSARAEHQPAAH